MIRTREEIQEKIDKLNERIRAIKALDPEEIIKKHTSTIKFRRKMNFMQ